jgi:hypothetical protein
MGSGKHLKRAQEKYGLHLFTKEYLAIFDNPDDMYEMESCLVNEEFVNRPDTYNIKEGGCGGFDYINKNCGNQGERLNKHLSNEKREKGRETRNKRLLEDPKFKEDLYRRVKETKIERYGSDYNATFRGKTHTEETKQKMSQKHKERLKDPTKHSGYGTMWITNGVENKKISKDSDIPEGWYKGRVLRLRNYDL